MAVAMGAEVLAHVVPLDEGRIAERALVILLPGVDLLVAIEGARVCQDLGAPVLIAPHELLVVGAPNLSPKACKMGIELLILMFDVRERVLT